MQDEMHAGSISGFMGPQILGPLFGTATYHGKKTVVLGSLLVWGRAGWHPEKLFVCCCR